METVLLTQERKAQLEAYALRRGQDPIAALDEVLGNYLEGELEDYAETVAAVQSGYADVKAGRTRPAAEFLEELGRKHGFSR